MDYDPKTGSTGSGSFGSTGTGSTGSTGAGSTGAGSFGGTSAGSTSGSSGFGSTGSSGATGSTGTGAGSFGATGGSSFDDAGTRAGSYDRKFNETDGGDSLKDRVGEKLGEGREMVNERLGQGGERLTQAVDANRNRIADQIERVGGRISERARGMENAGGVQGRAGQVALRASGALENSADYLRNHEVQEMRDDLEHAIRERPILSVGMAVGAGFLLARLLRD